MKKLFKTGLVLFLAIAMLVPTLIIPITANDTPAEVTYGAEIMNVKGGADSIATLTFDDGVHASSSALKPLLEKYGLKATLFVVPTRIQGESGSGYSNVAQLRELMEGGYIDIQSHSYSHLYIAEPGHADYKAENNTDENRYREVVQSYIWLSETFPEVDFVGFAVPGGSYDSAIRDLLDVTFYGVRNGTVPSGSMQTIDPAVGRNAMNWHQLKGVWLGENKMSAISDYLDTCVENGGWFISGVHNIVGNEIGKGNYEITTDTLETLLAEMAEYQNDGKLWVATFSEAIKYIREYQNSTVKQYENDYGMYVDVTMDETTEDGLALPGDVFDMPLTVKIEIPEGWENVRLSQKGESTTENPSSRKKVAQKG